MSNQERLEGCFLALSREDLASELSFFGSHDNGRSRRTPPGEFQPVVPRLLLCHQLGTVPSHLSSASNQWVLHGNMPKSKETGRWLFLIKRTVVYSPKHFSVAFKRQSSKQELIGRRIRASRRKGRGQSFCCHLQPIPCLKRL